LVSVVRTVSERSGAGGEWTRLTLRFPDNLDEVAEITF
jgi:hypothetical protein